MKPLKLMETVRPTNYNLLFDVDLEHSRFSGKETVNLAILRPVSRIILNASDLEISSAMLVSRNKIIKPRIKMENESERLILQFSKNIQGSAKLLLDFKGKLNDNLLGFYRSKYTSSGKEKYLATTQFEAPYARRAFPCFDEPSYKATFEVSLKIAKGLQAISNMPIKEIRAGNKKIVTFHRTPKMSTYLLYLGVGEFEFLEDKLDKISIRIATTPGKKEQCKFALDLTKKFLSYFQEYSGIRYPLPKLDLIALPDFVVGAMENWGAITFREIYLFFDPKMTSTAAKKRIAMIIAHELWHQWSGDLVTMAWWNDLWLSESFATFMAYKAVDNFFPEWNMWEDFLRAETERALDDDSLKTTHAINVEIKDPHQIEELFDAISYSKGGSILKMLESYLGEETFRKGVSRYLSKHSYGNAASEDLWNSLAAISNKPVKEIMVSWVMQAGYPLVEAVLNSGVLALRQKRFVFNNSLSAKWLIPLVVKTDAGTMTELLDKAEKKLPLRADWFKVNFSQSGFYRVKYDEKNISKLIAVIKGLSALDRWGVQSDLFKISHNGEADLDEYLNLLKSYQHEDSYLVLGSIYSSLRAIYFVFSKEDVWPKVWPKFKNHLTEPFKRVLDRLGWEPKKGEPQKDALLRELAINYLAFAEEPQVLKNGTEKFEAYLKKRELHPDIKSSVFYIAAANGDEKVYNKLVGLYTKTQSQEEKRIILTALGQFRNPDILKKALNFSVGNKVRRQDLIFVFSSVASNPESRAVLLDWVRKNWKILESYKKSGQLFIHLMESFITSYVSRDAERTLKKFFATHTVKYKMTISRAFEKMRRNIHFKEKNAAVLKKYFRE